MNKAQNMHVEVVDGCFTLTGRNHHFSDAKCQFNEHTGVLSAEHPAANISFTFDMTQQPFMNMRHGTVSIRDIDINAYCVKLADEDDDDDEDLAGTYRLDCMMMEFSWLWCKLNIN